MFLSGRKFRKIITILIISFLPISSAKAHFPELIGRKVIMPGCFSFTTDYTFIHIVRDQECTKCRVSALYQWNDVIAMIARKDISFYFIIETLPEDTADTIEEALQKRPFSKPMYIDYDHVFLEANLWLRERRYRSINDFILDRSGRIVRIGDPLNDFQFLIQLKDLQSFNLGLNKGY